MTQTDAAYVAALQAILFGSSDTATDFPRMPPDRRKFLRHKRCGSALAWNPVIVLSENASFLWFGVTVRGLLDAQDGPYYRSGANPHLVVNRRWKRGTF